jgi:hypothetical protein
MIAKISFATFVVALMAACASDSAGRASLRVQCDAIVQAHVGRPLDAFIESAGLGTPDARKDFVNPDQPGFAHWRSTFRFGFRRKCGGLDVYVDADGTVTGFNFWNDGVVRRPGA